MNTILETFLFKKTVNTFLKKLYDNLKTLKNPNSTYCFRKGPYTNI